MAVSGTCQLCETRTARHRCEGCGALVCGVHYETAVGRCRECSGGDGGRRMGETDGLGEGVDR